MPGQLEGRHRSDPWCRPVVEAVAGFPVGPVVTDHRGTRAAVPGDTTQQPQMVERPMRFWTASTLAVMPADQHLVMEAAEVLVTLTPVAMGRPQPAERGARERQVPLPARPSHTVQAVQAAQAVRQQMERPIEELVQPLAQLLPTVVPAP